MSCTEELPVQEQCADNSHIEYLVLCEGMYGYDNASLWGIGNGISSEIFRCINNRRLGDTANDLVKIDDSTFIIIVSTSNEIIKINREGVMLQSIQLKGEGHFLKQACVINDSMVAITDLYADKVYTLNHRLFTIDSLPISGLCAPDGIAYGNGKLAICNSGYGIFRYNEKNASTITMYDLNTGATLYSKTGTNPQNVLYFPSQSSWIVQFAHITTEPDSLGGLLSFSADLKLIMNVSGAFIGKPVLHRNTILCLEGSMLISYTADFSKKDTLLVNEYNDQWYRIGIVKDQVYICNARNYTLPGYISFLNADYALLPSRIMVGINPAKMIAINKD